MPDFMFVYRNPVGYTPTSETRAAWTAWFDGMGQHLADLGQLVTARTALGNCGPDRTELVGYSVIRAEDLEAATAIAKGCPNLGLGGGIEVGQLTEIPAPTA